MHRIKPNDKCHCNSDKKYKKCCMMIEFNKKCEEEDAYINGQNESSKKIKFFINYYKELFPKHKIIDITNNININNYKTYHIKNYNNKTIMLAEKTENNNSFFIEKANDNNNDIILMYKGVYRVLNAIDILKYEEDIKNIIETRDSGQNI
jgi:hypothetical protein